MSERDRVRDTTAIMTTTIPPLPHLVPPLRFLSSVPDELDADWIQQRYDELLARADELRDDDSAGWIALVHRRDELEAVIGSRMLRIRMAYRQNTTDEARTSALERLNRDIVPVVTDASVEVSRRIIASPCLEALRLEFGDLFVQQEQGTCASNAPVNTQLRRELSEHLMAYTKVFGTGTFTWRGEEHPLSFMRKAANDPDRDERHAAWLSGQQYTERHAEQLQDIFDTAMRLRQTMAQNLDLPSYIDLRYQQMQRYEYGPPEVAAFRDAVFEHVVPIVRDMHLQQAQLHGTELLHPADQEIQATPDPELVVSLDEQLDTATSMFEQMGDAFAAPWRMLVDEGLIDLMARPGKGTGASCATLPLERVPFLFCNSVGTAEDIRTLVHEFGHAMQAWRSRDIEPAQLRHPTLEACEIHSMTLELLALPYTEPLFGDGAPLFAREHVRSTISTMPYLAAIDEFQHHVYEGSLDRTARGDLWSQLAQRWLPGIDNDANEFYARHRWLRQLHVFQYPFYYIDYALARMVSWELWLDSLDDHDAAVERYLELCSLGGTRPFRDIIAAVGLSDPFDADVVARTITRLRPHLGIDA